MKFQELYDDVLLREEENQIPDVDDWEQYLEDNEDFWNEYLDEDSSNIQLDESIQRKYVWRKGKKVLKLYSDRKGFKVVKGKEIRMSPTEQKRRSRAAKRVNMNPSIIKKRVRSFRRTISKKV